MAEEGRGVERVKRHDDGGPLLPDATVDETAPGWGDDVDDSNDRRLLDERPPHWE